MFAINDVKFPVMLAVSNFSIVTIANAMAKCETGSVASLKWGTIGSHEAMANIKENVMSLSQSQSQIFQCE